MDMWGESKEKVVGFYFLFLVSRKGKFSSCQKIVTNSAPNTIFVLAVESYSYITIKNTQSYDICREHWP